ncbi:MULTISPECIES: OmpA family protein [Thiomicrorhabdus]|uniref:OmpA family protein n=1 Tax=Thiomicrorhabdus heinhorstiae TaxID=2748010 RepID=A0ABS0BW02_9GAMM|nr:MULTISPECIES: OmpA family protein [Thiomicrorhabdus]MBF6057245.1 OmpA family protein [Thiomicrorhabdus heinhorstiae]
MKKSIAVFLPVAALSAVFLNAPAQAANSDSGYVLDSNGQVVRDQFGGCVRNSNWVKDSEACGGEPEAKPVAKVEPKPVVQQKPEPEPIVVETVVVEDAPAAFVGFFALDKAELTDDAKTKLDAYAEYMQNHPQKSLAIQGYTDSQGSEAYNMELSQKRADAVKAYLVSKGIAAERMAAVGEGESNPVADNSTPEGRAQNRRVELALLD